MTSHLLIPHRAVPISETLRRWQPWVLLLIVLLFLVRNLPWNLDEYDQAKQAFVSYEMVNGGEWLYQHLPRGGAATKPPLAGWLSAALHWATGWEAAWRLVAFVPAVVLLWMLFREGERIMPGGGVLAAAAFGLNLTAPRVATLVRTDMLLTLWIFLIGLSIYRHVREGAEWSVRDRWMVFLAAAAGLMTKGPIVYAFLYPGMLAFLVFAWRWRLPRNINPGWWALLIGPLGLFVVWAVGGILTSPAFYEQVVIREFMGRFTVGEEAVHTNQPIYYYLPHLLHKWLPWSLLLIGLPILLRGRWRIRDNPEVLWLLCWAIGALAFMSAVPSKRVDRIFPLVPPLCLAIPHLVSAWSERGRFRERKRAILIGAILFGLVVSGGYAAARVIQGYSTDAAWLVRFGRESRALADRENLRFALVTNKEEGLLLYARALRFLDTGEAARAWEDDQIDGLVLSRSRLAKMEDRLGPYRVLLEGGGDRKNAQIFIGKARSE